MHVTVENDPAMFLRKIPVKDRYCRHLSVVFFEISLAISGLEKIKSQPQQIVLKTKPLTIEMGTRCKQRRVDVQSIERENDQVGFIET